MLYTLTFAFVIYVLLWKYFYEIYSTALYLYEENTQTPNKFF